jgi:hypothetical protein
MKTITNVLRFIGFGDRRKHGSRRKHLQRIERNQKAAEDVADLAKEVVATINGDVRWARRFEDDKNGHDCDNLFYDSVK